MGSARFSLKRCAGAAASSAAVVAAAKRRGRTARLIASLRGLHLLFQRPGLDSRRLDAGGLQEGDLDLVRALLSQDEVVLPPSCLKK